MIRHWYGKKKSVSDIPKSAVLILFFFTVGKSVQTICNTLILLHLMISVIVGTVYASAVSGGGFLTVFYCLNSIAEFHCRVPTGKQILKLM